MASRSKAASRSVVVGDGAAATPAEHRAICITPAAERTTSRFLSKFEAAKIVSIRANDIAAGTLQYGPVPSAALTSSTRGAPGGLKTRRVEDSSSGDDNDSALADIARGTGAAAAPAERQRLPLGDLEGRMVAAPIIFADPVMIAKHELVRKVLPFVVRRILPGGHRVEDIPLEELLINETMLDLGMWL